MDDPIQMGLNPSHPVTESIIHDINLAELVGDRWRDLGRAFGNNQAVIEAIEKEKGSSTKECCIAVLVRWMGREGRGATVGKLAEALIKIGLKSLAEKLICLDADQVDRFNKAIIDLQEEGSKMRHRIKELEEKLSSAIQKSQDVEQECTVLRTRNLELEKDLETERQQHQNTIQEGSQMCARIKQLEEQLQDSEKQCSVLCTTVLELEKELATERQQHQAISQECEDGFVVLMTNHATRDDLDTDQAARERRISEQLKNLDKDLKTYVTSVLQVPEVKEDKLRTAVKLDLLLKLSGRLQGMYSKIVSMAAETCKCGEDLKWEFYDFAYHGLRAEHNDLVPRVKDLESLLSEMSDEEKKEFERLQQHQTNRQREVDKLENLWRDLFSSPETLPTTSSDPTGGSASSSGKISGRNNTDPGTKQQAKSSSAGEGVDVLDRCKGYLKKLKPEGMFGRRESKDNMCIPVSYTPRGS